jgi:hypothetical protein
VPTRIPVWVSGNAADLGDVEIRQLYGSVSPNHQVGGFDVAVKNTTPMSVIQCRRGVREDVWQLGNRQPVRSRQLAKIGTLYEFHYEVGNAVFVVIVMHSHDIRRIVLIATSRLSFGSNARKTAPIPPRPNSAMI